MKKKIELNLNIPLLSVRRRLLPSNYYQEEEDDNEEHKHTAATATTTTTTSSCCRVIDETVLVSDQGVPFSWEQAPGKPKPIPDSNGGGDVDDDHRICLMKVVSSVSSCSDEEVASLSEAIDILELQRARHDDKMLQVVVEEEEEEGRRRPISPSFIINRFLPDANALAREYSFCYHHHHHLMSSSSSYSSSSAVVAAPMTTSSTIKQGCGLDHIFSWRTKRTTNK